MGYRTLKECRAARELWALMEGQGRRAGLVPQLSIATRDEDAEHESVHLMFPPTLCIERVEFLLEHALKVLRETPPKKGA